MTQGVVGKMKSLFKLLIAAAVFVGVAVSDSTSFKVHVIGDSTVCNYKDSAYPQLFFDIRTSVPLCLCVLNPQMHSKKAGISCSSEHLSLYLQAYSHNKNN